MATRLGILVLSLFIPLTAFAEDQTCLTQAIHVATEKFKSSIEAPIQGSPKISAEYINRNIYYINFVYTIRDGDNFFEKTAEYWAFSDYSENFNPLNKCVINSVDKI